MTERERLIELLNRHCALRQEYNDCTNETTEDCSTCLADFLLKNGVMVPPCKVGDTVYSYCEELHKVLPYFVENLNIAYLDEERLCYTYEANCSKDCELLDSIDFDFEDIGKTVFLTKEEAEAALKGGAEE